MSDDLIQFELDDDKINLIRSIQAALKADDPEAENIRSSLEAMARERANRAAEAGDVNQLAQWLEFSRVLTVLKWRKAEWDLQDTLRMVLSGNKIDGSPGIYSLRMRQIFDAVDRGDSDAKRRLEKFEQGTNALFFGLHELGAKGTDRLEELSRAFIASTHHILDKRDQELQTIPEEILRRRALVKERDEMGESNKQIREYLKRYRGMDISRNTIRRDLEWIKARPWFNGPPMGHP